MKPQLIRAISLTAAILLWLLLVVFDLLSFDVLQKLLFNVSPLTRTQLEFGHSLIYMGFLVSNALFFRSLFSRMEKLEVINILWRLFIIGMIGIVVILILIVASRLTSDLNMAKFLDPIFYNISRYAILIFFLSAIFIYRRFIMYQKNRSKIIGWWIGKILLVLSLLLVPGLQGIINVTPVLFILFAATTLFLSINVSWTAYLNFDQKLRTLGLFALILIVIITYLIAYLRIPSQFGLSPKIGGARDLFIYFCFVFALIYTTISALILFFNLPTSSVFEARSSEIASINKINQAIQSNLDFSDILSTLLDASILLSNARAGWVELKEEYKKSGQRPLMTGITTAEIQEIKQGFELGEKVLKDGKPYLVKNLSKHKLFRNSNAKYKSLLGTPINSRNHQYGSLFVVKELSNSFEDDTVKSVSGFADQAGAALENAELIKNSIELERYREQLKIAQEVQKQLLPSELPHSDKLVFTALSETADEIGGDYYDIVTCKNGDFKIAVGDVSGKGTTAAFYMAEIKGIFHALTLSDQTACEFVAQANQALAACLQKGFFMTLSYLHVHTDEQKIELVRAGHCPAFYYDAQTDELSMLREGTLGLGIVRDQSYASFVKAPTYISYKAGDFMVLYTDGIVEAFNEKKEEFGYTRLQDIIYSNRKAGAEELSRRIIANVKSFTGGKMDDDYTLLIMRFL